MAVKSAEKLRELRLWCRERIEKHQDAALSDPLASGVRMLTIDIWDRLVRGEISIDELSAVARSISDYALTERASRLGAKASPTDWTSLVQKAFEPHIGSSFDAVVGSLGRTRAGVVFTAHPTFSLPRRLRDDIGAIASGGGAQALSEADHSPEPSISLLEEHQDAQTAIDRAQASMRDLYIACFAWLRSHFPGEWWKARPALMSVATWVGYDLDGRTDIHWGMSMRLRLEEKALQLSRYSQRLAEIPGCEALARELACAGDEAAMQAEGFSANLDDPAEMVAAANRLTKESPARLVSLDKVIEKIDRLIEAADDDAKLKLCVLRSEMNLLGLGIARIHLRVNAAQIRSALRADFGFAPGREFLDRTALDAAATKTASARRKAINFGSIYQEQMTARRQLMLCAQILKHVDADSPLRFLIAEVEAPATVMGAIYLARLYGVDHKLDISPLFETPDAIERGGRFIERLLEEAEFVDYVRKRGRISIQCGFSDSGRFMGQIAADLAIERLHILVSRALAARNIRDIEVIIFNTHGESMGRGGHPGDFRARLDHLMTPWARARFERDGIALNAECSFQGGDGFLHFQTSALAKATMQSIFSWSQTHPGKPPDDRFYNDINFSWDVYRTVKSWQEALFANPHYQAVLSSFAPNLLPVTGSRKARRQSGASKNDIARSLRAIPHNAILQQLAAPANVLGGLGVAAMREPERFTALVKGSPRMRSLLSMAVSARKLTSLSILRTYASLYDPGFWTVRASRSPAEADKTAPLLVAERLSQRDLDVNLDRLSNLLSVDRQQFDAACRDLQNEEFAGEKFSESLYILHAIRMAMIANGLVLAASVPQFSPRHEITRDTLIDLALDLRFADVAAIIEEIFPESETTPAEFEGLQEPAERLEGPGGYPQVRAEISGPLRMLDGRIKKISIGISHFYDAFG